MYVRGDGLCRREAPGPKLRERRHIEELWKAVKTLHDAGYVHGDIRWPNVLITGDGLKLIDFDWCGEVGTAEYPADIFIDPDNAQWHRGVGRGV